jgi:hypothetical protein
MNYSGCNVWKIWRHYNYGFFAGAVNVDNGDFKEWTSGVDIIIVSENLS